MPPQSSAPFLYLHVLAKTFYLMQLKVSEPLPSSVMNKLITPSKDSEFLSVTRTREEISIVSDDSVNTEPFTTWCCIRVAGPMNLGLTGIMCDLTTPLKAAKIPIFAISTWDTDFLLVPEEKRREAAEVLQKDGWTVRIG